MSTKVEPPISAAVLTGGQSSRMGTDKALIVLGGMTILERTVRVLRAISADVVVVGYREPYVGYGVSVLADRFPGSGPLGGIATALTHSECDHVMVVGCDMPFLSERLLRAMAKQPRDYDVLLPVTRPSDGVIRNQPLHAIYSQGCLDQIVDRIANSDLRIQGFLDCANVTVLEPEWLRATDERLESFTNVNTPEELHEAAALARKSATDPKGRIIGS